MKSKEIKPSQLTTPTSREITLQIELKSPRGVTEADLYRELLMMEIAYNSESTPFRLRIVKIFPEHPRQK
jgi:hypothetical protein